MATWICLVFVGLVIGCVHAEQGHEEWPKCVPVDILAALQEQLRLDADDLGAQVRSLQQNVTDLWTYIYRLRQAIEVHLTDLTRRQSRIERSMQHFGGHDSHGHGHHTGDHSHGESGHHHEPLTSSTDHHDDHSSSDHHHDDHGSSDHHHDDHGSSDHQHVQLAVDHGSSDHHHDEHGSSDHHHDDHGSSDHHHDDHGSSDHHHDDHSSSDQHQDDHHHYSHSDVGDHHHTDEHHGDYHDDHHHGHHSSSESHTDAHSSHNDSDHSKEHDHGDHHHHHGDDSRSAEDQDQQTVQDVEKPFIATVVHSHHRDHIIGPQGAAGQNISDPLNLLGGHSHHHHHHHHHSHQDQAQQTYDAKVTIPKYSDYRQYMFATCDVQPNRVISTELQQEVKGQVSFWQKKTGGPLNIHVRLRGFSIGDHHDHQQQQEQTNEAPLHGAGHRHGFHVHEFGELSAGCQSTGAHYNPQSVNHGGPKSAERHLGDLGNIECDDHGVTNIVFADPVASLTGQYSIVGRALVIHSDVDDYGVNKDDPESLRTGNAGTRIACCVIQSVTKLPLATYKSMKLATNHQP